MVGVERGEEWYEMHAEEEKKEILAWQWAGRNENKKRTNGNQGIINTMEKFIKIY